MQATYFDPFCGPGSFHGREDRMMGKESCQYGSPIVALDVAMIMLKVQYTASGTTSSRHQIINFVAIQLFFHRGN